MNYITRYLIVRLLVVPCLVTSLHGVPVISLKIKHGNICTKKLPGFNISTVTNGSKSTLDGAKYFNCAPVYQGKAEIITWNQSVLQPQDYQRLFCPGRCRQDRFVILDGYGTCSTLKCFPCDCDKPKCQIYGTCCPDIDENIGITNSLLSTQNTSYLADANDDDDDDGGDDCRNTSHGFFQRENVSIIDTQVEEHASLCCGQHGKTSYLLIRSCPNYYSNNQVRTVCENELRLSEQNISTYVHVTDNETHATYFNEYCATCNDIREFTAWEYSVVCLHFQRVYTAQNDHEFLRLSLRSDSACNVTQIPPSNYNHYMCETGWFKPVVSECNVTGEWRKYDTDVVTYCAQPSSLLDRACHTGLYKTICYKNVFCAICNMPNYPEWLNTCGMTCMTDSPNPTDMYLPFSLLFNFGNSKLQKQSPQLLHYNAPASEWTSPDGRILPLECSPGKILLNGNCSSAIEMISGLAYNISIFYVPKSVQILKVNGSELLSLEYVNDSDYWRSVYSQFQQRIKQIISKQQDYMEISIRLIFPKTVDQLWNASLNQTTDGVILRQHTLMWYHLNGFIIATDSKRRDEFENTILRQLITDEFKLESDVNTSISFTPVVIKENQKHLFDDFYIRKNNLNYTEALLEGGLRIKRKLDIDQMKMRCLTLSPELSCPFVTFTKSDYEIDVNNDVFPPTMVITLKLHGIDLKIKDSDELNFVSFTNMGDLRVCHHFLKNKLSHLTSIIVSGHFALFHVLQILTITCISVSMLFLVLTLLTYILLLELRNSAGENIICMCSSLLLAQASLIVASQIKEIGYLCTVSGIIIHFLWLNMFCWCFTCSYNMFRVFTAETRIMRFSSRSKKELLIKLLLCLTAPAFVVCIVIVGNLLSTNNKRTGYGEKHCSLDSLLLMYITLFTPILIILISNFVFYLISVFEIHNVRKLQTHDFVSKQESSKGIYIYLKLSTVTGTFWILTVISEATNIDSLRVIAILLNGLQGVFIFVSFVCNKRVFKMYKHKKGF